MSDEIEFTSFGWSESESIKLPQLTEQGKKLAQRIQTWRFTPDGEKDAYIAEEVTGKMLLDEAKRLAIIPDEKIRTEKIGEWLMGLLHVVADCQRLSSLVITMGDELHVVAQQLGRMQ